MAAALPATAGSNCCSQPSAASALTLFCHPALHAGGALIAARQCADCMPQRKPQPIFPQHVGVGPGAQLSRLLSCMQRAINLTPAQVEDCIALRVCYLQKLAQVLKRRKQITARLAWVEDHSLSHTGGGL